MSDGEYDENCYNIHDEDDVTRIENELENPSNEASDVKPKYVSKPRPKTLDEYMSFREQQLKKNPKIANQRKETSLKYQQLLDRQKAELKEKVRVVDVCHDVHLLII